MVNFRFWTTTANAATSATTIVNTTGTNDLVYPDDLYSNEVIPYWQGVDTGLNACTTTWNTPFKQITKKEFMIGMPQREKNQNDIPVNGDTYQFQINGTTTTGTNDLQYYTTNDTTAGDITLTTNTTTAGTNNLRLTYG